MYSCRYACSNCATSPILRSSTLTVKYRSLGIRQWLDFSMTCFWFVLKVITNVLTKRI
jgi:hypothetical protein